MEEDENEFVDDTMWLATTDTLSSVGTTASNRFGTVLNIDHSVIDSVGDYGSNSEEEGGHNKLDKSIRKLVASTAESTDDQMEEDPFVVVHSLDTIGPDSVEGDGSESGSCAGGGDGAVAPPRASSSSPGGMLPKRIRRVSRSIRHGSWASRVLPKREKQQKAAGDGSCALERLNNCTSA